jgi:hypothetical protein
MSIKLMLLCKEGEAKDAYLKEANAIGLELDVAPSYDELFKKMANELYQGVMIDLATNIKASKQEKFFAQEALQAFPAAQLKWDRDSGSIFAVSLGQKSSTGTLQDFINIECNAFPARLVRLASRKTVNLNVLLCKGTVLNKDSLERTVTINISKGGCFLFSAHDWSNIPHACLLINELQDRSFIIGSVRWFVEWGKFTTIPGIGISFDQIKQGQLEEITDKFIGHNSNE